MLQFSYMYDIFIKGVPLSTQLVLGTANFTIDDLLSLPRLSDTHLEEKGIYIDVVQGGPDDEWCVVFV